MSTKLPVWLRGVSFGFNGDFYTIDNNNSCVEKHVCSYEDLRYKRPAIVKFCDGALSGARPLDIIHIGDTNGYQNSLVVSMDNGFLVYLSTDLAIRGFVKLFGRCTGLAVGFLEDASANGVTNDMKILAINATDNTLDILTPSGDKLQSIPLPRKLGLCEKHGYLCASRLKNRTVIILSSSRGVFAGTLDLCEADQYTLNLRDEMAAEEKFSPQGVCLIGDSLFIANSRDNKVLRATLLSEDSGNLKMRYETCMSVVSPCAVDGWKSADRNWVCVTTLAGKYELIDF